MARSKGWKACLNCGEDHQTSVDVDLQVWTKKPQEKCALMVSALKEISHFTRTYAMGPQNVKCMNKYTSTFWMQKRSTLRNERFYMVWNNSNLNEMIYSGHETIRRNKIAKAMVWQENGKDNYNYAFSYNPLNRNNWI